MLTAQIRLLATKRRYLKIDYYPDGADRPAASQLQAGFREIDSPPALTRRFLAGIRRKGTRRDCRICTSSESATKTAPARGAAFSPA